jgi:hypothetical protein
LALPLEQDAVISACGRYRYLLTRRVGPGPRTATFLMLNPSTADATNDDPTIRRCLGFARRWGCKRLVVLNLFAVRATDPADMKRADDPVGPENPEWFDRTLRALVDGPVVCAWGVHGAHLGRDQAVLGWLDGYDIKPLALGITREGHPKHPLYLSYGVPLISYSRSLRTSVKPPRGDVPPVVMTPPRTVEFA